MFWSSAAVGCSSNVRQTAAWLAAQHAPPTGRRSLTPFADLRWLLVAAARLWRCLLHGSWTFRRRLRRAGAARLTAACKLLSFFFFFTLVAVIASSSSRFSGVYRGIVKRNRIRSAKVSMPTNFVRIYWRTWHRRSVKTLQLKSSILFLVCYLFEGCFLMLE